MGTFFDYLTWRGDLSLLQSPLNNVDSLLLSALSYLPFEHIVPFQGKPYTISIKQAAKLLEINRISPTPSGYSAYYVKENLSVLSALAETTRFQDMQLSFYTNEIDIEKEQQFSALTISLDDNNHYLAFRGTDNTLVGWKENFNMAYNSPIPSQELAATYTDYVAQELEHNLYLGGHSKGGNLAMYAAIFCKPEVQERIVSVDNFDGPGFDEALIKEEEFCLVKDKVLTFLPQDSIIGVLLEHLEEYTVVQSRKKSVFQHDYLNWEIEGPDFIHLDSLSRTGNLLNNAVGEWLTQLDAKQRSLFFETLYTILLDTEAQTLTDLVKHGAKNTATIFRALKEVDPETKKVLTQTWGLLFDALKNNMNLGSRKKAVERKRTLM